MNTYDIAEVMHMSPDFYGVVPSCEIEQFKKYNVTGLIVNTDPHNKSGQHWVGLYKEGKTLDFFDSFGREIKEFKEPFVSIMNDFSSGLFVNTNRKQYQDYLSDTCGRWCYYYILSRICGITDFTEFTNDTLKNEIELERQLNIIKHNLEILR